MFHEARAKELGVSLGRSAARTKHLDVSIGKHEMIYIVRVPKTNSSKRILENFHAYFSFYSIDVPHANHRLCLKNIDFRKTNVEKPFSSCLHAAKSVFHRVVGSNRTRRGYAFDNGKLKYLYSEFL